MPGIEQVHTPEVMCKGWTASCSCTLAMHDLTNPHVCACGGSWIGDLNDDIKQVVTLPDSTGLGLGSLASILADMRSRLTVDSDGFYQVM